MRMFVEEVRTKKIKEVIGGFTSSGSQVSIERPDEDGDIRLVIGADWSYRGSGWFSKESLTELIDNLTEVRDLMEGTEDD